MSIELVERFKQILSNPDRLTEQADKYDPYHAYTQARVAIRLIQDKLSPDQVVELDSYARQLHHIDEEELHRRIQAGKYVEIKL